MLAEWILSASVLTAAVLVLRLMFRRRISQKLQYWLWLPVLLRLLIPVPLFRAPVSVAGAAAELAPAVFAAPAPVSTLGPGAPAHTSAPVSSAPAAATPADGGLRPSAAPVATPAPAPVPAVTAPSAELPEAPAPSLRPAPAQPRLLSVGELLARLWLAGSLASGLWLLGVNLRFSQRLRAGRREKGRQGRLPVYISPEAASPCLFGLLRPAIYLTEACETVPEGQLRQILLHEETHYKQLDHLWGCLRCLALAVWWWNPLVWLAAVCSRRDGELSCDEKVMLSLGEEARLDYGRTLVALLPAKAPRPMLSAATLSGGARAMKERLDRIVKRPKSWVLAAVAVLLLALAAVGCAFAGKGEGAPVTPTPAPTLGPGEEWLLADRTAEEIDAIQYHLFTWETYTLRRGMEGFDEALDMLLALRGAPCGDPPAGPSVKWTLDFGKRVNLDYDGSALRGFFSDHWLDLSAMGRPDEALAAIFERYGEKYVPETRLADHGDQAIDGKMKVSAEYPVYDYDAVQAAIGQRKRDYLATGDRNHEPDGSCVMLTLENTSEDDLAYGDLMLEVRRDGAWYGVWLYNDFGSQAVYNWLYAGETKERRLDLSFYDDPLTPGLYRVVIPYGASGRSIKLNRIAWAEFEIRDGATQPEPWDGKEPLMGKTEPEKVSSILCRLPYEDRYTLREGDMGFAAARDFLFSLRGTPCERPDFLVLRSFEPDEGPAVTLGFDGERVYGCLGTGFWLLLDAPGRPDQELTEVFLRWGEKEVYTATYPSEYEGMAVDENVTLTLDKTVVDRNVLLAEMAAYRTEYMERGRLAAERFGDFTLRATLVNDSGETIRFGEYAALEMLQDGEWRTIPMRSGFGYFNIAHILEAGGVYDNLGVSFLCYYEEMLTPGRYRLSLEYKPGRNDANPDHVAFAEFELTDGPPQPMVYIPLWQDYPATEDHEAYHLNFRVPAGWSSVDLSPEEARAQGLLYLYNGTEDRHYIRDEAGKIIGAFGCMSYEETPGEETEPRAIYSSIAVGNGYRFDVSGSYAPLARRDRGESGRVKVVYSEAFLRPFVENAAEMQKEGFLCYDRALGVYAAVELEPGVLTEEEMDTLARSLHMEPEEPGPAPVTKQDILAAYEAAREAFRWFEVSSLDFLTADWTDVREEGYQRYYLITDPRFASWDTLEAYLLSLFDDETVRARLSSGPFKEFDGRVYGFSADAGTDQTLGDLVGIRVNSRGEDRYVVSADYARLEPIMLNGESTGTTQVGFSSYDFPYVWQGDRWAFEGFRLVETDPGPLPEPGPSAFEPLTEAEGTDWLPLSYGARRLTSEELADWKAWFDADWMRSQFLTSAYARPEDVDLRELFYNGVDTWEETRTDYNVNGRNPVTKEDVRYLLLHLGFWHTETDSDKLPRSQVDAVLQKYLGLGLDETAQVNFEEGSFPYIPETDSFYHMHGDTNAVFLRGFLGGYAFGEEISLFYSGTCPYYGAQFPLGYDYLTGVYRVKLRRTGEGVHFISNLRMLTDGVNWTCEEPMPGPAVPADYSGDFGVDVTVLTPELTVFGSYEEAMAATEGFVYRIGEEDYPIEIGLSEDYPGYGTLVYGAVSAGLPHGPLTYFWFVTSDGRRYDLPRPVAGFSEAPLDISDKRFELADEGRAVCLDNLVPDSVRWWIRSKSEMAPVPGNLPKGDGSLSYILYLPTMEVIIWFRPEEGTLADSLSTELEGATPEPGPVARFTPEPEVFGSYEEARADTEAISFQWVDKPHTYEMAVKTSDPIAFDLERAYPGFGTLLCGHLPDDSPHGDPTYLYFLTEEGVRYRLPTPCTLTSDLPLDDGGAARAEEGEAFRLEFPEEDKVRWWTHCEAPVSIYGALYDPESMTEPGEAMFRGGTLVWDLDVSTMEVSIWFQPEV